MLRGAKTYVPAVAAVLLALCFVTASIAQEPSSRPEPKSHRMPMQRKFSYSCDDHKSVDLFLRERNARLVFAGETYALKQVQAASGARYAGEHLVWWSKGESGFLEDHTDPRNPKRLADHCKLVPPAKPAKTEPSQ